MIAMNRSRISSFGAVILGVADVFDVEAMLGFWQRLIKEIEAKKDQKMET